MPAQAGIQKPHSAPWIPAFAGMTFPLAIYQNFNDLVLAVRVHDIVGIKVSRHRGHLK